MNFAALDFWTVVLIAFVLVDGMLLILIGRLLIVHRKKEVSEEEDLILKTLEEIEEQDARES